MKENTKLQSLLARIIKSTQGEDEKDENQFDFHAQEIYGFIRDSYQMMKSRNDDLDFYEYDINSSTGIYIRNTVNPYFVVVLQWGLANFEAFRMFCDVHIHESGLVQDCSISNLEFFIMIRSKKNGHEVMKKMRVKYNLANDPMFLAHAVEGHTYTFCKGLKSDMDKK